MVKGLASPGQEDSLFQINRGEVVSVIHLLHSELELGAQHRGRGKRLRRGQDFLGLYGHLVEVLLETLKLHLDFLCETEENQKKQ